MPLEKRRLSIALRRHDPRWILRDIVPLSRRASLLRLDKGQDRFELVMLSHSAADRQRDPHIARHEYQLLQALGRSALPVAKAVALIETHEPPFLLCSRISGAPRFASDDLPGFCRQLAATLSAIHALAIKPKFLPRLDDGLAGDIGAGPKIEPKLRSALAKAGPGIVRNRDALLHGDFWLGNLLWQGERLSGIIDWEDAMLGDPLADLGKSRLELLWALGGHAMRLYTRHYLALKPGLDASALPYWDLWGAARLGHFASFAPDKAAASRMRALYQRFVSDALAALQE